jgi:sec-independent protein translocase protein TatA
MFGLGFGEILVILVIALIFIGPKKLPEMAKNLGKGIREFQRAKDGLFHDLKKDLDTDLKQAHQDHTHSISTDADLAAKENPAPKIPLASDSLEAEFKPHDDADSKKPS